jgi:hypothetical protein
MPDYDKQLIVQFLNGVGDTTILQSAQALNDKATSDGLTSSRVTMTGSSSFFRTWSKTYKGRLTTAFTGFPTKSRVYLVGHGGWVSQKLADWDAHDVADLLAECGMPAVKVVSLVGCQLGRDKGTPSDCRVGHSMNSFASKFHKRLKEKHNRVTVVYARIYLVKVANSVEGEGVKRPELRGQKTTANQKRQSEG